MSGYIYVRNWKKRQHHKYDSPPWHKVYNSTLRDDDYLRLSAADRGVLHDLWTLASLSGDGRVSADRKFLARVLNVRRVNLEPLIEGGFITVENVKSTESQSLKSAVDMQVSVNRTPLESGVNAISDSSDTRSDAGSREVSSTNEVRVGDESVTTEKSREDPLTPASGGLRLTGENPRAVAERAERASKRAAARAACKRTYDGYLDAGEKPETALEWMLNEYRHDPSIVDEAIKGAA
jgi:hypothetical protein